MLKLPNPQFSFIQSIEDCISGITGNDSLQQKLTSTKEQLASLEPVYLSNGRVGTLHSFPSVTSAGTANTNVICDLTKSELIKIYDQYFVPEKKPARRIYDQLMNSAEEKCPFCGGIGTPRTLDHFLPKAHFPQFSVLPMNLVPSCRDCNMDEKGHEIPTRTEDQIIHPYVDHDRFFYEQWIFACYHVGLNNEPGEFEYYVSPPQIWNDIDKQRVQRHFNEFNLEKRYSIKAAAVLNTVLMQINRLNEIGLDRNDVKSTILQPGIDAAPFKNHWQTSMYQSLIDYMDVEL